MRSPCRGRRLFAMLLAAIAGPAAAQEAPGIDIAWTTRAIAETRSLRERAMRLLERFGMAHLAEHEAGGLAYGHQRRVEMMRALASDLRHAPGKRSIARRALAKLGRAPRALWRRVSRRRRA